MLVVLQTKFTDGKWDKARVVGKETMPGDQNVEEGETNMRFKVLPRLMHHVLEVADLSQHRENHVMCGFPFLSGICEQVAPNFDDFESPHQGYA